MTPTPRLVPDRPSDAALAKALYEVGDNVGLEIIDAFMSDVEHRAREIDAAAPPAEAPAERGVWSGFCAKHGHMAAKGCADCERDIEVLAEMGPPDGAAPAGENGWAPPLRGDDAAPLPQYPMTTHPNERVSMTYAQYLTLRGAAPAAPAEGWMPKDNDGKEQDAFEAWAKGEQFDMSQHPLHWLFLNERTNVARKGWRGALAYVKAQSEAATPRGPGGREDLAADLAELAYWRNVQPVNYRSQVDGMSHRERIAEIRRAALQAANGGEG